MGDLNNVTLSNPQDVAMFKAAQTKYYNNNPSKGFTDDYGAVNMISFLSSVWSRLAYMNDHDYLGHYSQIFGPIIPNEMLTEMNANANNNIFNDTETFNLNGEFEKYGLKTYMRGSDDNVNQFGNVGLQFAPWAQKINQINGEERFGETESMFKLFSKQMSSELKSKLTNCNANLEQIQPDNNIVFVSIATSNYRNIYITGDKRMPNIVLVTFRGTYSLKSARSYLRPNSIHPVLSNMIDLLTTDVNNNSNNKKELEEAFLFGIDKLLMDVIHDIIQAIKYVSEKIKNGVTTSQEQTRIITTGHSLGGGLCTLFAYYCCTRRIFEDDDKLFNKDIVCLSLGSPRVFGKDTSRLFCWLTKNNEDNQDLITQEANIYGLDIKEVLKNIQSRILYLRITSYYDPVPGLPSKAITPFYHPCSKTNYLSEEARKNITVDCLVQVSNGSSTRCIPKQSTTNGLSMTNDYNLPLNCVNIKERKKTGSATIGLTGLSGILIRLPYHCHYLGINYIRGVSLTNVISEINRYPNFNGDTVCRICVYPEVNDNVLFGSVVFYNLNKNRSINVDDTIEATIDTDKADNSNGNKSGDVELTSFKPQDGGNYTYSEDVFDNQDFFNDLIKNKSNPYQLLKVSPPLNYAKVEIIDIATVNSDNYVNLTPKEAKLQLNPGNSFYDNIIVIPDTNDKTRKSDKSYQSIQTFIRTSPSIEIRENNDDEVEQDTNTLNSEQSNSVSPAWLNPDAKKIELKRAAEAVKAEEAKKRAEEQNFITQNKNSVTDQYNKKFGNTRRRRPPRGGSYKNKNITRKK